MCVCVCVCVCVCMCACVCVCLSVETPRSRLGLLKLSLKNYSLNSIYFKAVKILSEPVICP